MSLVRNIKDTWTLLEKIMVGVITVATIAGLFWQVDRTYAKDEFVKQLELRLDQKINNDRADAIQKRMWLIEDRYKNSPMPQTVEEEVELLECEYNKLINKVYQAK